MSVNVLRCDRFVPKGISGLSYRKGWIWRLLHEGHAVAPEGSGIDPSNIGSGP